MSTPKLGLIGIMGQELEHDFWGTARTIANLGYQGIEHPGFLLKGNVEENVSRFNDLGLEVVAYGPDKKALQHNIEDVINTARQLRTSHIVVWWSPASSKEVILQDASFFNEVGARLADAGLTFVYHNHEHEFKTSIDGVAAWDLLLANTDPKSVFFEVDIAWATFGGADPAALLRRMAGRVSIIHVKDLSSLEKRDQFTAVGSGIVNIKGSIEAARDTGVKWMVIEQDKLRNLTPLETITASYLNLKETGLLS